MVIILTMYQISVFCKYIVVYLGAPRLKVPTLDGRIVGGEDANIEDYPYQLSLEWYGSHICGASIISKDFAVTAAHCTEGSDASQLSVRAGSSIREEGGTVIKVAMIQQNPNFNPSTFDNDISILHLETPLELGPGVQPVVLPSATEVPADGADALVSGWGTLSSGGSPSSQLQVVTVQIVNQDECNSVYFGDVSDTMICAGVPEGGKDSCQGDSGGPLVVDNKLQGIVSWGYGCAEPGFPGVYSRVTALRDFINQTTGI